jgi:hypothetical protein
MQNQDTEVAGGVAKILKLFEYSAVSLLLLTVLAHLLKMPISSTLAVAGICMMLMAPIAGAVAAGWLFFKSGRCNLFYISLVIVVTFVIALWVSK